MSEFGKQTVQALSDEVYFRVRNKPDDHEKKNKDRYSINTALLTVCFLLTDDAIDCLLCGPRLLKLLYTVINDDDDDEMSFFVLVVVVESNEFFLAPPRNFENISITNDQRTCIVVAIVVVVVVVVVSVFLYVLYIYRFF